MRREEVPALLAGLRQFQWVDADGMAVAMWDAALDDMPLRWALEQVARYYGKPGDSRKPMVPGMLNLAWRDEVRVSLAGDESHCGRVSCRCEHRACYRGFVDGVEPVRVCRVCHPEPVGGVSRAAIASQR